MTKYILGIDCGLSGALCLYSSGEPLIIFDMPTHEITKNGKKKKQIDTYALGKFIDTHGLNVEKSIIEMPSAMPGQGVTSSWNFGLNVGIMLGVIAANFIPMQLVAPATWKKAMKLSKDKDASRLRASQMAPHEAHNWTRVKDDGRAESFLLAVWGEMQAI